MRRNMSEMQAIPSAWKMMSEGTASSSGPSCTDTNEQSQPESSLCYDEPEKL